MKEGLSGRVLSGVEESRCLGVAIGAGLWCEKSEGRGRRAVARFGRVVFCVRPMCELYWPGCVGER